MRPNPYLSHLEVRPKEPEPPKMTLEQIENSPNNIYTGRPFSPKYGEILRKRRELPVFARRQEFLQMLYANQFIILVGETGSGKTTQYSRPRSADL